MFYEIAQKCVCMVFDTLFPPTHEAMLVRNLTEKNIEALLFPRKITECTALLNFKDERVRALIHEAKFHANETAQMILGQMLKRYLKNYPTSQQYTLIPIPLSRERLHERGYNQVSEVIRYALNTNTNMTTNTKILTRTKNTRPQTSLPKHERAQNVAGAFQVKNPEKIAGTHILLIDDVFTTGATMHAAKLSLLQYSPASVTCVALAH